MGSIGEQHLAVAQVAAQHAPLVVWPEGPGAQPVGVQPLQPLTSEPSGCRAAGGALGVAGIDEEHLHAPGLSKFKHGHPVDPGGCHGAGGHATGKEPVGEGIEVGSEGAETAYGLRGAIRWDGHPVLGFADVDACGVGVADLEGFGEHG